MKKKSKQVVLITVIAVLVIAGFIGTQVATQLVRYKHKGLAACQVHFETETGEPINIEDLTYKYKETVFPTPFDKRFRAECTFGKKTVLMEATPFKDWYIIDSYQID